MAEKSLQDRFQDLDKRLEALEADRGPVTPEEHDVAELFNDLRGKRERLRGYFDRNRGTAATWASSKDAPEGAKDAPGGPKGSNGGGNGGGDPSHTAGQTGQEEFEENRPLHSSIADDAEAEREMQAMERAFEQAQVRFR